MEYILAGLLGAVCGSALTALLHRQATNQSWFRGRSQCPRCKHVLAVRDLIPIVSYLLARGRCRYCGRKFGRSYPAMEVLTAALFVLVLWVRLGPVQGDVFAVDAQRWSLIARDWAATVVLLQVFFFDLRHGYILDQVTLPAVVVFFVWNVFLDVRVSVLLLGIVAGAACFGFQYLVSQGKWVGSGDIRLGALMGALVGWPLIVVALFFAYVGGGLFGIFLLATKRKSWGSQIPFGTFLSAATLATLLWGYPLVRWYVTTLL